MLLRVLVLILNGHKSCKIGMVNFLSVDNPSVEIIISSLSNIKSRKTHGNNIFLIASIEGAYNYF